MKKRILFAAVALLLAVAMTACSKPTPTSPEGLPLLSSVAAVEEGYDYSKIFSWGRESYTDRQVPVVGFPPITDADVEEYILDSLMENISFPKEPLTTGTTALYDKVGFYFRVLHKGTWLTVDGFENYTSEQKLSTVLGRQQVLEEVENALIGVTLGDAHLTKYTGDDIIIGADDQIYIRAKAELPEGVKLEDLADTDYLQGRFFVDMDGDIPADIAETLTGLAANETEQTYPLTRALKNGGEVEVTWRVTIYYAFEEQGIDVTFCLPEDYLPENDPSLSYLNGEEVTFRLVVTEYYPGTLPEFDADFILNVWGAERDDMSDEELVAFHREELRKGLEEYQENARNEAAFTAFLEELKGQPLTFPAGVVESKQQELTKEVQEYFDYYKEAYKDFPYETVGEYAVFYFGVEEGLTLDEITKLVAEDYIKERLVVYYVAISEGLLPKDENTDGIYKTFIQQIIDSYAEQNAAVTREMLEQEYGVATLLTYAREEYIVDVVTRFLKQEITVVHVEED